jgi:hypothetical protein
MSIRIDTCLIILILIISSTAQSIDWQGQASSWLTIRPNPGNDGQIGIRYIPSLTLGSPLSEKYLFDSEISANIYGTNRFYSENEPEQEGQIKPYRGWIRLSASQFGLRAGLQKINFGSAALLRPLMWFDHIDPRDPLQLTDGVYALLGRYYFLNNANVWLWCLYGNDETKGWEIFPGVKNKPEFGGRLQVPLWTGEIAISAHYRVAKYEGDNQDQGIIDQRFSENRLGLDGKWDIGIGIWFEGTITYVDINNILPRYNRMFNLGLDYTFDIGNGLYVVSEYLRVDFSDALFTSDESSSLTALSSNYPLGLLDNLQVIFYYDWDKENTFRFVSWQRIYDQWSFYTMGFWNSTQYPLYGNKQVNNLFSGKGFQFMVVFNH